MAKTVPQDWIAIQALRLKVTSVLCWKLFEELEKVSVLLIKS